MNPSSQKAELIIYFRGNSCAPCKKTSATLDSYSQSQLALRTHTVTIDDGSEDAFEMAMKFGIRQVPSIIVLDDQDNVINSFLGCSQITVDQLLGV